MTEAKDLAKCPICKDTLTTKSIGNGPFVLDCPKCGKYSISREALDDLPNVCGKDLLSPKMRALVSHYIMGRSRVANSPLITLSQIEDQLSNGKLPSPQEQLDNLLIWIDENISNPNQKYRPTSETIAAIGAVDLQGVAYIARFGILEGLIEGHIQDPDSNHPTINPLQITLNGWKYLDRLKKGKTDSSLVFMAMPFGNEKLEENYKRYWKTALKQELKLSLKKLNENQPAGLIDDRMRVEIRQSKFLIAELTNRNSGAYWEAGYAEGLGKPVIYLCEKKYFKKQKTHFDTNHHTTVVWDSEKMDEAKDLLIATIKATFPDEFNL